MNLLWLDRSPVANARAYSDRLLVEKIVEYAQVMSIAVRATAPAYASHHGLYAEANKQHPTVTWVMNHCFHYKQLYAVWYELLREFEYRFKKPHSCTKFIMAFHNAPLSFEVKDEYKQLPPVFVSDRALLVFDSPIETMTDIVEVYRYHYVIEYGEIAEWTNREMPDWFFTLTGEFGIK